MTTAVPSGDETPTGERLSGGGPSEGSAPATDGPGFDAKSFCIGVGATLLVGVMITLTMDTVDSFLRGEVTDEWIELGVADGQQTGFAGIILSDASQRDCEAEVVLESVNGSQTGEVVFFECDEDLLEGSAGVNATWNRESGELRVEFDDPPDAGTRVRVSVFSEPVTPEFPPLVALLGMAVSLAIVLLWLASAVHAGLNGPRAYTQGVVATVVVAFSISWILAPPLLG